MSTSLFLIDGYNLIHALGLLDGEAPLERARQGLERMLRAHLARAARGTRIVLVYDGAEVGRESSSVDGALTVRFSRPPSRADDVILELARAHEGSERLRVVTSDDFDIGRPLRGLGVQVIPSRAFAARLGVGPAGLEGRGGLAPGRQGPALAGPEVETWVRAFGLGEGPPATTRDEVLPAATRDEVPPAVTRDEGRREPGPGGKEGEMETKEDGA